ncbi:transmembrane protein 126A L homeolog isoform X2 [Xenopus laevis]|nr:transmembrane protein 126A L homeolog isoform X2 [Xenopus laevis]XP_018100270.1 transmembrane protein 126A L homeolog isoform X2 [Xenopus laevis]XP_018100271.1 transmembrane protein 126A L homeolog isoform X2 [Xenopus laevis]OCT96357.1 hypothetical protein XELAEV_18014034mg [Xenopus laevis]
MSESTSSTERELLTMNPPVKQGQRLTRENIIEFLAERFNRLPENERKLFTYGSIYLGINSAFAGLIANSLFRRILHVSQAWFSSSLPMAVLPFLTSVAIYNATVTTPMLTGDLNCATCAVVRGGLIGTVAGGLYPILLALPVNGGLAARYQTTPLPEKGNILRFWTTVSQPVLKKMSFVLILQAMFGVYISSRHYTIYEQMLKLPPPGTDLEELPE